MKRLQLPDCQIIGTDKKIRTPSVDRANNRSHLPSIVICEAVLNFAYQPAGVSMRTQQSYSKSCAGQCNRNSGSQCSILCRKDEALWLRRVLLPVWIHW